MTEFWECKRVPSQTQTQLCTKRVLGSLQYLLHKLVRAFNFVLLTLADLITITLTFLVEVSFSCLNKSLQPHPRTTPCLCRVCAGVGHTKKAAPQEAAEVHHGGDV